MSSSLTQVAVLRSLLDWRQHATAWPLHNSEGNVKTSENIHGWAEDHPNVSHCDVCWVDSELCRMVLDPHQAQSSSVEQSSCCLNPCTIRRLRWHDTWRHTEAYSKLSFLACVFCSKLQQDLLKHGVQWDKIGVFYFSRTTSLESSMDKAATPFACSEKIFTQACPGEIPVLSQLCLGVVALMSQPCPDLVPVISRAYPDLVSCPSTVMSGWCPSHSDVMFRWCPRQYYGDANVSVVRRCRCSHIAFMFGWFLGHFQILFHWCLDHILILCLVPVQ